MKGQDTCTQLEDELHTFIQYVRTQIRLRLEIIDIIIVMLHV